MIALTKEKRDELIAKCNKQIEMATALKGIEISIDARNDLEDMILMSEVTLASLTAGPIGIITDYTIERLEGCNIINSEFKGQFNRGCNAPVDGVIYASPPVSDIKLPHELMGLVNAVEFYHALKAENPDIETGMWNDAYDWIKKAAVEAAPVIKRLNGLGE